MKNIEYYYDELINEVNIYKFCSEKGMKEELGKSDNHNVITWLNEEHQVLNEKEKEYLSAVIKPFRKDVEHIAKERYNNFYYFIRIRLKNGEMVELPLFDPLKDMYVGMGLFQEYPLEELGL